MSGCLERFLYVAVLATPSKTLLTISYSLKIKVTSVAFWFKMKCASKMTSENWRILAMWAFME